MESTNNIKYLQGYGANRTVVYFEKLSCIQAVSISWAKVMVCQCQDQVSNGLTVSPFSFVTLPPPFEQIQSRLLGEHDTYYKEEPISQLRPPDQPTKS